MSNYMADIARIVREKRSLFDALEAIVDALNDGDDVGAFQIGRAALAKARGEEAKSGVPSGSREPKNGNAE